MSRHSDSRLASPANIQQFQIWQKNLSGFQITLDFRKFLAAKPTTCQDYVKNLTGLTLNLELLTNISSILQIEP